MDEGLSIAYPLLEKDVPVYAADGTHVGTVNHLVAAQEQDIFHGVVIDTDEHGRRFVPAELVASLHERGVDLSLAVEDLRTLPEPGGDAPVYVEDPAESKAEHWKRLLELKRDWRKQR